MRYELTDDERAAIKVNATEQAAWRAIPIPRPGSSQRCDKEKRQDNNYAGVAHR